MLKVGVYARVSTKDEKQKNAVEKQIEQLVSYVEKKENWELYDIYADKGFTGTETSKRKNYNRLVQDVEERNIDIVIIKNETRLNRNTYDALKFLNILVENDVKLFFYLEKKYYNPEDDLDIKIKLMLAEQHSRDLSKNINASQKARQLKGGIITNGKMWGYTQENAKLEIKEDEAEVVKKVFEMYADGKGFRTIQQELKFLIPDEIKERRNIDTLPLTTLKRMIKNEKYKGLLIHNKKHKNFFTKKISDVPEEKWVIIEDGCPAIVSEELWEKANDNLSNKKKAYGIDEKAKIAGYFNGNYFLSGKIFCGKCGKPYWHCADYSKNKKSVWVCSTYKSFGKKNGCETEIISTPDLITTLQNIIFQFSKNKNKAIENVISVLKMTLEEPEKNKNEIDELEKNLNMYKKRQDNLVNNLLDKTITKEIYKAKEAEINTAVMIIEKKIKEVVSKNINTYTKLQRLEVIKNHLEMEFLEPKNISEEFIKEMVEKIVIVDKEKINVVLAGNLIFDNLKLLKNEQNNNFQSVSSTKSY